MQSCNQKGVSAFMFFLRKRKYEASGQVSWLSPSRPPSHSCILRNSGITAVNYQTLQLREQPPDYTGFPFNSYVNKKPISGAKVTRKTSRPHEAMHFSTGLPYSYHNEPTKTHQPMQNQRRICNPA